jgi:hypothetical protein
MRWKDHRQDRRIENRREGGASMESWQKAWRDGLAPQLSAGALRTLRQGLATDDPRLVQGATTSPPPLQCVQDWAVEAACALGYCGWQGEGLATVQEVESFFAQTCFEADRRLGDGGMVRWFLNWFDDAPRAEMRRLLLVEVNRELERRQPVVPAAGPVVGGNAAACGGPPGAGGRAVGFVSAS